MRTLLCAALVIVLAAVVLPQGASAAPADCVDILVNCAPDSTLLTTVCGKGLQELSGNVATNISFVVFGPDVQAATLIQCGTGAAITITQSTDLCGLSGRWNDNVCAISLTLSLGAAPAMSSVGLMLLGIVLFAGGVVALRRRVLRAAVGVAVLLVLTGGRASAQLVACCVPSSTQCQLLSSTDCTNARGIEEGPTCLNVQCGACCQGIGGGNPNACSNNFPIVSCIEGVGTVVPNAHCQVGDTATTCVPNPATGPVNAPALDWTKALGVALLLASGGIALRRRRAH